MNHDLKMKLVGWSNVVGLTISLVCLIASGCATFRKDKGDQFPAEVKDYCQAAKAETIKRIRDAGIDPKVSALRVKVVNGEKLIGGMWCVNVGGGRMVGARTHGNLIMWPLNPADHRALAPNSMESLMHEMAHPMTGDDLHQDPRLRKRFINWVPNR
jgi:hypothetical protein